MTSSTLYKSVRSRRVLHAAWRKVRSNGLQSTSLDTRLAIQAFDEQSVRGLERIERQLLRKSFTFAPQTGIAIQRSGKAPRPIVIAAVENRIVQRAILDIIQAQPQFSEIRDMPNSFGGIVGRGTRDAIECALQAIKGGATHFIRSDIQGFFNDIPRGRALEYFTLTISDSEFLALLDRATTTELANLGDLGDDSRFFPTRDRGVAQGSALSPLLGNVLLREFDRLLNSRGIVCLRFIDDFIILGRRESHVQKAFQSGLRHLGQFGLSAYDPAIDPSKAEMGKTCDGFEFLGCTVRPDGASPSAKSCDALLGKIDRELTLGRRAMQRTVNQRARQQRGLVQTLTNVDLIIRGWYHAFSFCSKKARLVELDQIIGARIGRFRSFAKRISEAADAATKQRVLGVRLLGDGSPIYE